MSRSSRPHAALFILEAPEGLPCLLAGDLPLKAGDRARLVSCGIAPEALDRVETFQSAKRRREFLWGRLLLARALKFWGPDLQIRERAPLTPAVVDDAGVVQGCASISHTQGLVAVMLSASNCAVDLEVMNPARVRRALVEHVFGAGFWEALAENPTTGFYALWGLYETAVKLGARLELTYAENGLCAGMPPLTEAYCGFSLLAHNALATVVASSPCPVQLMRARPCASSGDIAGFEAAGAAPLARLAAFQPASLSLEG